MAEIDAFVQSIGSDIVFIVLLAGFWFTVTAVYVPGLGVPETGAALSIIIGVFALLSFEVRLVGIILLVLGLGCFLTMVYYRHHWWLSAIGFVLQLLGSIFLFRSPYQISVWTILITNVAAAAYFGLILIPGLRVQDRRRYLGDDALMDLTGQVLTTIDPIGSVRLQGETWRAEADRPIEAGTSVRVVRREGLLLTVEPVEPGES